MNITRIFTPEHGLNGVALAGNSVQDSIDEKTKIPVVSLYGKGSGKQITQEVVNDIEALFFDIQDSGMRHYTYISTLLRAMQVAAQHNKLMVVLDRPNPLGLRMEGPLVEDGLHSFISIASIPLRHGMTVGELAWYFNLHVLENPAKLHVIPMKNYDRQVGLNGTLPQPLSPNIQHIQSCFGYSFLGLLGEIEPFKVGVGTDMAFRCILLPASLPFSKEHWGRLQELLKSYGITSSRYSYVTKKKRQRYVGLKLHIQDINTVTSFPLLLALLQFFNNTGLHRSYSPMFNKAVGTKGVRKVMSGKWQQEQLFQMTHADIQAFFNKARSVFIYKPFPQIGKY